MSRVLSLFLTVSIFAGCSQLPCKPPSYYSPDPAAPYTAEEVRLVTKKWGLCRENYRKSANVGFEEVK